MHACRYEKGRKEIIRGAENAADDKEHRYINPEETSELEKRLHYVRSCNTKYDSCFLLYFLIPPHPPPSPVPQPTLKPTTSLPYLLVIPILSSAINYGPYLYFTQHFLPV